LGNPAALSEKQNKSLQDRSWAKKRQRFQGSKFKSTQKLRQFAHRKPEIIERRTETLAKWVVEEWPDLSQL